MAVISGGGMSIEFSVITGEDVSRQSVVAKHPLETGEEVHDHVKASPPDFTIKGIIVGNGAGNKYAQLVKLWENGELCGYSGESAVKNVVIKDLQTSYSAEVGNGFRFSMRLQVVRLTESARAVFDTSVMDGLRQAVAQINADKDKGVQQKETKAVDGIKLTDVISAAEYKRTVYISGD